MNHADALREMSVERYMLGELTGTERDSFEEHMFECSLCAADLKTGVLFANAARGELAVQAPAREKSRGWFEWLLRPQWMGPALAACLLVIGYQGLVQQPALQEQIAAANSPHIVGTLSFSSGAVRGGGLPQVNAAAKGSFVLQVDLPPQPRPKSYLCSLYAPSGTLVWKGSIDASQAGDTVSISVPTAATQAGRNTLVVQGDGADAASGTLSDLAKHEFLLEIQK